MSQRDLFDDLRSSPDFLALISNLQGAFDAYYLLLDEFIHVDGARHHYSQRRTAEMIAYIRDQGETYLDFYMPGYGGKVDNPELAGSSNNQLMAILREFGWFLAGSEGAKGRARYTHW